MLTTADLPEALRSPLTGTARVRGERTCTCRPYGCPSDLARNGVHPVAPTTEESHERAGI